MNDLPVLGLTDVATVLAAFVAYAVFLVVASVLRLGRGLAPILPFNRAHLRLGSVYIALAVLALWWSGAPFGLRWGFDFAVGAFFYAGLHYAVFLNFFGMAKASVSSSIISITYSKGSRATRAEIVGAYAGGQGFDYIKRSRLERLEQFLGWIERVPGGDRYRVTTAGLKAIRTTRFFLKSWSLNQLGAKP